MNIGLKHIMLTVLTLVWFMPLMVVYGLSVVHIPKLNPNIIREQSFFDVLSITAEIWMMPGRYLSWLLPAITPMPITDDGISSFMFSAILFSPFCVWPFLRAEKHQYLKRLLQAATVPMLLLFVFAPVYIRSL